MKVLVTLIFLGVLSTFALSQESGIREMPAGFESDGCTMFPDGDCRDCCVEHDKDYFLGGSLKERRASDKRLFLCVKAKTSGHRKILAPLMWLGVRIGGVSFLPTRFRWGFGSKWPRRSKDIRPPTGQ